MFTDLKLCCSHHGVFLTPWRAIVELAAGSQAPKSRGRPSKCFLKGACVCEEMPTAGVQNFVTPELHISCFHRKQLLACTIMGHKRRRSGKKAHFHRLENARIVECNGELGSNTPGNLDLSHLGTDNPPINACALQLLVPNSRSGRCREGAHYACLHTCGGSIGKGGFSQDDNEKDSRGEEKRGHTIHSSGGHS